MDRYQLFWVSRLGISGLSGRDPYKRKRLRANCLGSTQLCILVEESNEKEFVQSVFLAKFS